MSVWKEEGKGIGEGVVKGMRKGGCGAKEVSFEARGREAQVSK